VTWQIKFWNTLGDIVFQFEMKDDFTGHLSQHVALTRELNETEQKDHIKFGQVDGKVQPTFDLSLSLVGNSFRYTLTQAKYFYMGVFQMDVHDVLKWPIRAMEIQVLNLTIYSLEIKLPL